ncbi:MAG: hypothetical protein D3M94_13045 [Rhodocyclales bacterium GT-UBC]|nr:MAG: hypothetical protein D3M94_13045 [Rhodocyclales bacterium GT-UBC]
MRPGNLIASCLLATITMTCHAGLFSRDDSQARIEALFKETRPVCFGRFIIDIPATAEVAWGPSAVDYDIVSYPGQGYKIPAQINSMEKELKDDKHLSEPSTYIGTFNGTNPESKIVVGYSSFMTTGLVQIHSYVRLDKNAFSQSVKSLPLADLPDGKDDKTSYKKYVSNMLEVANHLRVRDESEIPSESGICIEAGFVSVPDERFHETTSIGFRFPEYPDIRFSIRTSKTDSPSQKDSLEYSLKAGQENFIASAFVRWLLGLKILHQGPRQVGDWVGYEAFVRMPPESDNQPSTHEFHFKSIGKARDILRPYVDMELSSGVSGNTRGVEEPSLSNDEMTALWNRLAATIRARPTREASQAATPY